jgi:hypothetical protein
MILVLLPAKSSEQNLPWGSNCPSAGQEILRLSWNSMVHNRAHIVIKLNGIAAILQTVLRRRSVQISRGTRFPDGFRDFFSLSKQNPG